MDSKETKKWYYVLPVVCMYAGNRNCQYASVYNFK